MKSLIPIIVTMAILYFIAWHIVNNKAGEEISTIDRYGNHVKDIEEATPGIWTKLAEKYFRMPAILRNSGL